MQKMVQKAIKYHDCAKSRRALTKIYSNIDIVDTNDFLWSLWLYPTAIQEIDQSDIKNHAIYIDNLEDENMKLEDENMKLKETITNLQFSCPIEGGDEYQKAKRRFDLRNALGKLKEYNA